MTTLITRLLGIVFIIGIMVNACVYMALTEKPEAELPLATISASARGLQPEEYVCGYPGAYTVLASALKKSARVK
jgi:hypothetical protein